MGSGAEGAGRGQVEIGAVDIKLVEEMDAYLPSRSAITDKLTMPIEMCSRYRGTVVNVERGVIKVGEEVEIGALPTQKTICTGVEMFLRCWTRVRRATTWACCCAVPSVTTWSGPVLAKPKSITPHTHFEGGVCAEQGRGRSSHAVFQQLSSAVLLPHDGCDRSG